MYPSLPKAVNVPKSNLTCSKKHIIVVHDVKFAPQCINIILVIMLLTCSKRYPI